MLSGLFRGSPEAVEERSSTLNWPWFPDAGATTWAGVSVSRDSALQLTTVYGCVRLISDSISTLPLDVYRRTASTPVEIAAPPWLRQPTVDLDFTAWAGQVLSSLLLDGNAYIAVTRGASGSIVELLPMDPASVSVRREAQRKVFYVNGVQARPDDEIVHIKGLMLPGSDTGLSPVEYARQSIGLGLATVKYGSQFFDGPGNLDGVIELPRVSTPEKMRQMASQWQMRRRKGGRGLPGVLDDGATWKPMGVTNEQAQFLATRKYTAAEIAGQVFMLDPSDLGIPVEGTSLTYANLEQRNARRVQVTFLPWIVRLEAALSSLLAQPRYVKLNVSGLLRGDARTRWDTYYLAEQINLSATARGEQPVLTTSEIRDFEDLGPVEDQ